MRQLRFESIGDLDLDLCRNFILEAVANEEAGVAVKPRMRVATQLPKMLRGALTEDEQLAGNLLGLSQICSLHTLQVALEQATAVRSASRWPALAHCCYRPRVVARLQRKVGERVQVPSCPSKVWTDCVLRCLEFQPAYVQGCELPARRASPILLGPR